MTDRERRTLPLRRHHGWKAKAGFKLFIIDRGAARFLVPQDWVVVQTDDGVKIYDRPAPDDQAFIGVSLLHVPPHDLSSAQLLEMSGPGNGLEVLEAGEIAEVKRPGLAFAWVQLRHRDPAAREAFSRMCIAHGRDVCVLLTLDFWVDDLGRVGPVWDEILASLELGRYVADPTIGDVDQN